MAMILSGLRTCRDRQTDRDRPAGRDVGALSTGLTINAAFLQEIKDDHLQLRALMQEVEAILSAPTFLSLARLHAIGELLEQLRDQLAMHFALEEAFGYFEDAVGAAPRISQRAEQLRLEHDALYVQLCLLSESAEELRYRPRRWNLRALEGLTEGYAEFCHRFEQHESDENALIFEALAADVGVGD